MSNTLAIDFGTSNSAAAVMVAGTPYLIEIEPGETTLPTALFFDAAAKAVRTGRQANDALFAGEDGRYMRALKSVLGTALMHEDRTLLGRRVTFVDVIAEFLSHIKSRAETLCHQTFDHALSGRPVHFHSANPDRDAAALKDLTECYRRAGFKSVTFLNEPEAAALATDPSDGIGLIVDIGGGTSDFTLFERQETQIKTIASHGIRLGGTNFDRSISIDQVMPLLGRNSQIKREFGQGTLPAPIAIFNDLATWEKIPFLYAPETLRDARNLAKLAAEPDKLKRLETVLEMHLGHELAFAVERGKITCNAPDTDEATIDMRMVEPALRATLSKQQMRETLSAHMQKLADALADTLALADLNPKDVSRVTYVGGSSLLGGIEETIRKTLPDASHDYKDVFTAVISGLARATL
jgi:hypothetical chaperone protein